MQVMARPSCKKTWQTGRQRVSVVAALAIQRENVVNRLVRLRTDIGHPEKSGEPLPQDQAAARAGVTARQWQRWESGASVPYARNLSAVADAFGFDVAEFYDGPAGKEPAPTPSPFGEPDSVTARLDAIMERLEAMSARQGRIEDMINDGLSQLAQALNATAVEQADRIVRGIVADVESGKLKVPPPKSSTAAAKRAPKRTRAA